MTEMACWFRLDAELELRWAPEGEAKDKGWTGPFTFRHLALEERGRLLIERIRASRKEVR